MKALVLGAAIAGFTTVACLGTVLAVQGKSYHFAMLLPVFAVFFLLIAWLLYLKQDRLLGKSSQAAGSGGPDVSGNLRDPDKSCGSSTPGRPGRTGEPDHQGGFAGQLPVTLYADLRDTLVSRSASSTEGSRNSGQGQYRNAESPGQDSGYGYAQGQGQGQGQGKKSGSGSGYGSGKGLRKLLKGILWSVPGNPGAQPVAVLLWAAACIALVSVVLYFLAGTGSRYFLS